MRESMLWTYNFAKTPFVAANAPLPIARTSHRGALLFADTALTSDDLDASGGG